MSVKTVSSHTKLHTKYITKNGQVVPSVTTILSELAKPALIHWAWKLGTEGVDYRKHTDELALVGKLLHSMILHHLKQEECPQDELNEYSKKQIDLAENSFISFLEWEKGHKIEPVLLETPLVSEKLLIGGTPDYYGLVDGVPELLDFKTGKSIYDEYAYQLAGYEMILEENGYPVKRRRILRVGRDENEGFDEKLYQDLNCEKEIVIACRNIYYLKKEIKNKQGGR